MWRRCNRFKNWIDNNGLIDLGFSGPKFTWARGLTPDSRKEARLDRALCNNQWRVRFQEGRVRHLPQLGSDHSPLLISTEGFDGGTNAKRPFRFLVAWTTHGEFEKLVNDNWCHNQPLSNNLKELASVLGRWNTEVFGNLFSCKRRLWARIEGIQKALDAGGPWYLRKLEARLREKLSSVLDHIESLWFQKARVEQIRDGDRNTKFFHTSTIIRRRFNRIESLKDSNDEWQNDPAIVKGMVVDHFQKLFSEECVDTSHRRPRSVEFPMIAPEVVQELERPLTEADVLFALKGMQPLKAPGPEGFQAFFFQKYWRIVGGKVCNTVLQVLSGHGLASELNETFITLIPKVSHPERVQQFRPIGLCNVAYKLITKCIVNRLKGVLPHVISPMQSSFVPGRQITDNIVVMQELLHSMSCLLYTSDAADE